MLCLAIWRDGLKALVGILVQGASQLLRFRCSAVGTSTRGNQIVKERTMLHRDTRLWSSHGHRTPIGSRIVAAGLLALSSQVRRRRIFTLACLRQLPAGAARGAYRVKISKFAGHFGKFFAECNSAARKPQRTRVTQKSIYAKHLQALKPRTRTKLCSLP
jgi:hypothetical protein